MQKLSTTWSVRRGWYLAVVVGLLLLYVFLRLNDLLSFPAFLDEVDHIDWADDIYDLHPFTGARNGKLFGLWWMALFGLHGDAAFFIARASTVLFSMLGAAAVFGTARHLLNVGAGIAALALYCIAPYSFFYDRLALTDTYVTVWAAITVWLALRYMKRSHSWDAVLVGLALTGGILAKATGIVLIVIPALAYGLLAPGMPWRARIKGLVLSYGAFVVSWGAIFAVLRWRGYGYFGTATSVVGTDETSGVVSRVLDNIEAMWAINGHYFSLPFLLVGIALAAYLVWRSPRVGLFLAGVTLIPLVGLLTFATKLSPRYFSFHVPFLLLLVGVAGTRVALDLWRGHVRAVGMVLVGSAVAWGALFALPFIDQYWRDPAQLDVPPLDRLEYMTSDAAGFALPQMAQYLTAQAEASGSRGVVVGLFANCGALEYYVRDTAPLRVVCPKLKLDGSHQPDVIARLDRLAARDVPVWVVFEKSPYITLQGINVSLREETTFTRPDKRTILQVLHLERSVETERNEND